MDRGDGPAKDSRLHRLIYRATLLFLQFVLSVFFRSILCIRSPKAKEAHCFTTGVPVIFAIGLHANQFIDPVIVTVNAMRPISMLIAKVSTERRVINFFASILGAIPVARRSDYKRAGSGLISVEGEQEVSVAVSGVNTRFGTELVPGDLVTSNEATVGTVERVCSDTKAVIRTTQQKVSIHDASFSILPKLDHSEMYQQVIQNLCDGQAIGIFPEGGSHDQPFLQPFHSGVAVMALETLSRFPSLQSAFRIVPVGLNYFHRHKFRSRATIEFGDPIQVSPHLIAQYSAGGSSDKKLAVATLSSEARDAILKLTVNASSPTMNEFLNAACRLFKPGGYSINSVYDRLEVMKQFSQHLHLFTGEAPHCQSEYRGYFEQITLFLKYLALRNISLRQLETWLEIRPAITCARFILKSLVKIVLFLPGFVLNAPSLFLVRQTGYWQAERARKTSPLKARGFDVVATWKLLVGVHVFPLQYVLYCWFLVRHYGMRWIGITLFLVVCFTLFGLFAWLAPAVTQLASQAMFYLSVRWNRVNPIELEDKFNHLVEQTNQLFQRLGIREPEQPTDSVLRSFFDYDST